MTTMTTITTVPPLNTTAPRRAVDFPKRSLHVLIVQDSENDTERLAQELERGNYEVTCERVETAEMLESALGRERWDIVLCDFALPRFNGSSALPIVREHDPDLPFIYVSETFGEETAIEALKAGAQDYVMKDNLSRLVPAAERGLREAQERRNHRRAEYDRQRQIAQLRAALVEAKRLNGLMLICSRCKRIHGDGDWQEVENYIQENTEARISHTICPDCIGRLEIAYPEMQDLLRD